MGLRLGLYAGGFEILPVMMLLTFGAESSSSCHSFSVPGPRTGILPSTAPSPAPLSICKYAHLGLDSTVCFQLEVVLFSGAIFR